MQSNFLKKLAVNALNDIKGKEITTIKVANLTDLMDYMIICTGTSSQHVKALANNVIVKSKRYNVQPHSVEGHSSAEWVLVDLGEVVVHVMQPETRSFYNLEQLWTTSSIS